MDDSKLILSKIDSLHMLVNEKHTHLDNRLDSITKEVDRNKGSIDSLFTIDRKQEQTLLI